MANRVSLGAKANRMAMLGKLLSDPLLILGLIGLVAWWFWTMGPIKPLPPLTELEACLEKVGQANRIERKIHSKVRTHCDQAERLDPFDNPCRTSQPRSKSDRSQFKLKYSRMYRELRELRETYPSVIQARAEAEEERRKRWEGRENELVDLQAELRGNFMRQIVIAPPSSDGKVPMNVRQEDKRPIYISKKGMELIASELDAAGNDPEIKLAFDQAEACAGAIL